MEQQLLKLNELVTEYGKQVAEYEQFRMKTSFEETSKKIVKITTAHMAVIMFVKDNFTVKGE